MATVEDIQDVHAAQRANAEVEADIAEFDENILIPICENSQEKIESKYLELINQVYLYHYFLLAVIMEGYKHVKVHFFSIIGSRISFLNKRLLSRYIIFL